MSKTKNQPKSVKTKISKKKLVKTHIETHKTITSLEAIKLYSATRLSAIIFNLRKSGMDITTKPLHIKDKYGNDCIYAQYILQKSHKVKQSISAK
jgi:hypothetical protein